MFQRCQGHRLGQNKLKKPWGNWPENDEQELEDGRPELGDLEEVTSEIAHCRLSFKSVEDIAAGHSLACV